MTPLKKPGRYNEVEPALTVERHAAVPIEFEGLRFARGFRADLIVNRAVVVELKSTAQPPSVHVKQLLTYLKLLDIRLGLVSNFGLPLLKDGIKRVVNGP